MRASAAVLITGCSTGIGRATAERLASRGWTVYATARRPESIADLTGCRKLALDVTEEGSMRAAVEAVEAEHGSVGVLINNAGYAIEKAIETVSIEEARRQFETNFFGLARMCQLVLPGMRRERYGRIVNVSSVGGKLTFPGGGYYHASKHAVEAFSDALRYEVKGFGVDVTVIEPGLIRTAFGDTATATSAPTGGPYDRFNKAVAKRVSGAYSGVLGKLASVGPGTVAAVIERAIASPRPRSRYRVTPGAHVLLAARKVLPDRAWDALMRLQFPRPKPVD